MDTEGAKRALESLALDLASTERLLGNDPETATYRVRRWIGWFQQKVERAIGCLGGRITERRGGLVMVCTQCGDCCRNNGPIPPLLPLSDHDADAPTWLRCAVKHLVDLVPYSRDDVCCMFFDDENNACTIYEDRPAVCRASLCEAAKDGEV